jgi:multiple sugar transport system substrate-binding protein
VTTSLWPQYWAQGQELFDAQGRLGFADGTGYEAMRASLGAVERAVAEGVTPQSVANFGSEDDMEADMVAGRVAMFMGGNWQAASLDSVMPDEDFFRTWEVSPLPTVDGSTPVTSAGGWLWGAFTEDREKVDAAVDWVMQSFVGDTGMASWCSIGGYLPPRKSVYDHPTYEQNPFTPQFREHLEKYARTRPAARDYQQVSNALRVALSNVSSGSTNATQALDEALTAIV